MLPLIDSASLTPASLQSPPEVAMPGAPGAARIPRRKRLSVPRELRVAPRLDPRRCVGAVSLRHALLINPFYPKDPHASFGKHVLTPTLALTSVAGTTPQGWTIRYWDENLLQGSPPSEPFQRIVGISVHLTFARRAFELAEWY